MKWSHFSFLSILCQKCCFHFFYTRIICKEKTQKKQSKDLIGKFLEEIAVLDLPASKQHMLDFNSNTPEVKATSSALPNYSHPHLQWLPISHLHQVQALSLPFFIKMGLSVLGSNWWRGRAQSIDRSPKRLEREEKQKGYFWSSLPEIRVSINLSLCLNFRSGEYYRVDQVS